MWYTFLSLLILQNFSVSQALGKCSVTAPKGLLYGSFYRSYFHWMNPVRDATKSVNEGVSVKFYCSNGFVRDDLLSTTYVLQCSKNGLFNNTYAPEELLCRSQYHKPTVVVKISSIELRSVLFRCESPDWQTYEVKSLKADGTYRVLYRVCFDKKEMKTKFVFQPKVRRILGKEEGEKEKRADVWGADLFGNTLLEKAMLVKGYTKEVQQKRLSITFHHIHKNKDYPYEFHRGHFAPYADFSDPEDKKATCEFINAAPQWSRFNSASWSAIEQETRKLVSLSPSDWEIYTGSYGTITTSKGPVYVSYVNISGTARPYVPIPKLYWKVVYNTINITLSQVYVGINDPELKDPQSFPDDYKVCNPISVSAKQIYRGSEKSGFVYKCELKAFFSKLWSEEKIIVNNYEKYLKYYSYSTLHTVSNVLKPQKPSNNLSNEVYEDTKGTKGNKGVKGVKETNEITDKSNSINDKASDYEEYDEYDESPKKKKKYDYNYTPKKYKTEVLPKKYNLRAKGKKI